MGKKLIVFIIGIIGIFLLLEMSLRIIGYVHLKNRRGKKTVKKGNYVILCVGDSFTEGAGAPPGKGYPGHLERLLDKKFDERKKITVLNRGVSSYNTSQILEKFKNERENIYIDLVILLGGGANQWNFWGYGKSLDRENFFSRIKDFFYNIKIYKLIKLIEWNLTNKVGSKVTKKKNNIKEKNEVSERVDKLSGLAEKLEKEGKWFKAIEYYKKIIQISPRRSEPYLNIGMIYTWQLPMNEKNRGEKYRKLAKKWLRKAIKLNPESIEAITSLTNLYRSEIISYNEYIKILSNFKKSSSVVMDFLKISRKRNRNELEKEILRWIYSDIQKIISLCKSNDIDLIMQNYPYRGENRINILLEKVANKHFIPFVDNFSVFRNMWREGYEKENFFVSDGHCNSKGYKIMAENIYKKIKKEKILNFN